MTWGARAGRAGALTLLALLWAAAAHAFALPHSAGSGWAGALIWSAGATGLLAWWATPAVGGSARRTGSAGALVLGVGQLLTHGALSLAPLLAGQVRGSASAHLHVPGAQSSPPAAGGMVLGLPDGGEMLAALGHGGPSVLATHVVATALAALTWALAGALWHAAGAWWARVRPATRPRLRVSATLVSVSPRWPTAPSPAFSWTRRGPPALAG